LAFASPSRSVLPGCGALLSKQHGKRQPSNGIAPKLKRRIMPEKKRIERARQEEHEGKAPSTQGASLFAKKLS